MNNPGRLNLLNVGEVKICMDYGHNPEGYRALIDTVGKFWASRLVGVIGAPGDRQDRTLINVGKVAGEGFDFIYIKEDQDLLGGDASRARWQPCLKQ